MGRCFGVHSALRPTMRLSGGAHGNNKIHATSSTSPVGISAGIRRSNDGAAAGSHAGVFQHTRASRQEYSPVKQPPTPTFPASTSPLAMSPPPHHSSGLGAPPKLVHPFWSKVYQELSHHIESGLPAKEFSDIEEEELEKSKINSEEYKECTKPVNQRKNRYGNILPYDTTRVVLKREGDDHSDYINANWINGSSGKRTYVAAQAPLPATFEDWWRMIWENQVVHIVMLTREVEGGKRKAHCYWPTSVAEGELRFGAFSVTLISETMNERGDIATKKLKLKRLESGEERLVLHFHYLGWPDHEVPTDRRSMLEILELFNNEKAVNKLDSQPAVIHCSAGIGRTGTFIVTDIVLQMLKQSDPPSKLSIADLLRNIRSQRAGMINQEEQYVFAYQMILDEVLKLAQKPPS